LQALGIVAGQEEFIAVQQREGAQVPLWDEPDLTPGVGVNRGIGQLHSRGEPNCSCDACVVVCRKRRRRRRSYKASLRLPGIGETPASAGSAFASCSARVGGTLFSERQERTMNIISRVIRTAAIGSAFTAASALAVPPSTQPDHVPPSTQQTAAAMAEATSRPASPDQAFIDEAAKGGVAEVTLGQLAAQRAVNADVRQFGQQMADDHSKANAELLSLGMDRGARPPNGMDADAQAIHGQLALAKGAEFDCSYIDAMVNDHRKDIDAFKKEADNGQDATVKAWAGRMLPVLQHHLRMAENLQRQLSQPLAAPPPTAAAGTPATPPQR
jgi:putative membrane protein